MNRSCREPQKKIVKKFRFFLIPFLFAFFVVSVSGAHIQIEPVSGLPGAPDISLPGFFVPIQGGDISGEGFMYHGYDADFFLLSRELQIRYPAPGEKNSTASKTFRVFFDHANSSAKISGKDRFSGSASIFTGSNASGWQSHLPLYGSIVYQEIYPGTSLHYSVENGRLKSRFLVAPHADPGLIAWHYDASSSVAINQDGALVMTLPDGTAIIDLPPEAYQILGNTRREVAVSYNLLPAGRVGFSLGDYDKRYPLEIDPEIVTSGFLGGDVEDSGYGITTGPGDNIYVIGYTHSPNFPVTADSFNTTAPGYYDVFVTAYNKDASDILYSAFLGGAANDNGRAIVVDQEGVAYITGSTECPDFPVYRALQPKLAGNYDAFIAAISPDGSSLLFSSYLGGRGIDDAWSIAQDRSDGTVCITGMTKSPDFPQKNAIQQEYAGGFDVFVTCFDNKGKAISSSTFLGGKNDDYGRGIALDRNGSRYITGYTYSSKSADFPVKKPLMDPHKTTYDAFVSKISPDAQSLEYSTYIGGTLGDRASAITVSPDGAAYISGYTYSEDFPTTPYAFCRTLSSSLIADAFVAGIAPDGQSLLGSTYLGGKNEDVAYGITTGTDGNFYLTGGTLSPDFPTKNAWQSSLLGPMDAYVTGMDPACRNLVFSSYLGGEGTDSGSAITHNESGILFVTGTTGSRTFPLLNAHQPAYGGGESDAFLAGINPAPKNSLPSAMPLLPISLAAAAIAAIIPGAIRRMRK